MPIISLKKTLNQELEKKGILHMTFFLNSGIKPRGSYILRKSSSTE